MQACKEFLFANFRLPTYVINFIENITTLKEYNLGYWHIFITEFIKCFEAAMGEMKRSFG
jgi:hypothetical protein